MLKSAVRLSVPILFALASALRADCTKEIEKPSPASHGALFELRTISPERAERYKRWIDHDCFVYVLEDYFGPGYSEDFPDWIIYIPASGPVKQRLVHEGEEVTELREQSHVWAFVIAESPPRPAWQEPATNGRPTAVAYFDTSDVRLSRRIITFKRDPTITLLIKGLAKGVGLDAPADATPGDTVRALSFHPLSDNGALWGALGRVSIAENTEIELSLTPVPLKSFANRENVQAIYANVSNARQHLFELGIMGGMSYGDPVRIFDKTAQVGQTNKYNANAYLTTVINLSATEFSVPRRPAWQKAQLGIMLGTNVLRGSIGDEFVAGGVIGHLLNNAGIAVGAVFVDEPKAVDGVVEHGRRARPILGFDLRF